jgi:SHO1 osmosensor
MLCVIIGVFVVIASDTTQTYHVAIVGYLACGLVLTSSSVNATIYSSNGAREAAAAGHILLSMVNVGSLVYAVENMLTDSRLYRFFRSPQGPQNFSRRTRHDRQLWKWTT